MAEEALQIYRPHRIDLGQDARPPLTALAEKLDKDERTWIRKGGISYIDNDDMINLEKEISQLAKSEMIERQGTLVDTVVMHYHHAGPLNVKQPLIVIPLRARNDIVPKLSPEDIDIGWAMHIERRVEVHAGVTILVLRFHPGEEAK